MKLTVFMPVYNRENYLKDSISSVLNQDFEDFELLIIDDGSTDKSIEIIKSFKDNRIRLLKNETNKGVVFTRNRGLEEARGEYILLLDSDDIALPGRLRKQVEFMDLKPDASIITSGCISVYSNGKQVVRNIIEDEELIEAMMIFKNCVVTTSSIINKSKTYDKGIMYRDGFFYGEDYAFAVDALKYGKIYGQNEKLALYKISSEGSITSTVGKRRKEITENIMFYIRKTHLENNEIYLTDHQTMNICEVTAQPVLVKYDNMIEFLNTLEEIRIQNKKFNKEKLNLVLEEIANEIIYFSQQISYKEKLTILKKYKSLYINSAIDNKKLFIYHMKFNFKKILEKFKVK